MIRSSSCITNAEKNSECCEGEKVYSNVQTMTEKMENNHPAPKDGEGCFGKTRQLRGDM